MATSPAQNPDWARDEIILALDLYMQRRKQLPGKASDEIRGLSDLLRQFHRSIGTAGNAKLRNANGVYMKLMNLRGLDPEVQRLGRTGLTGGGRLEREVWDEFSNDIARLHRVAAAIATAIREPDAEEIGALSGGATPDEIYDDEEAPEGRLLTRRHRSRERNRHLVGKKKVQAARLHGRLTCEACQFDFEASYGPRGVGFIECHHTKPVETLVEGSKTKLSDLSLLCANCHRMIHARRPWLSVQELRAIVRR